MAEIKVEPKRGGMGWLWAIIVLALLGAAIWYFMNNSRAVPATTSPADSTRTSMNRVDHVIDAPSAVSFVSWEATSHG
jgi:hypothetical protein